MMYVVMYYVEYEGYYKNKYSRVFADKEQAELWAEYLNVDLAKENGCKVKDLGDYYDVLEMHAHL